MGGESLTEDYSYYTILIILTNILSIILFADNQAALQHNDQQTACELHVFGQAKNLLLLFILLQWKQLSHSKLLINDNNDLDWFLTLII